MMKKAEFKSKLIFTIIGIAFLIVTGCENREEENWIIPSANCVFVDHHIHTHGELIEGNYQGGLRIDFPTYRYNKTSKVLSGDIDFEINKSLKLIYGDGKSLSGVVGSGMSTGLYGIYNLPYSKGKLEIKKIEADGTVHIQYNDSLIVLKSNEEWVEVKSRTDTQNFGEGIAKATVTTTDKFVNYGIIEKSSIEME